MRAVNEKERREKRGEERRKKKNQRNDFTSLGVLSRFGNELLAGGNVEHVVREVVCVERNERNVALAIVRNAARLAALQHAVLRRNLLRPITTRLTKVQL